MLKDLQESVPAYLRQDRIGDLGSVTDAAHASEMEEVLVSILINDKNPVVRHEAAFSLGRLFSSGAIVGVSALEALKTSVTTDLSVIVRHESAEALGNFPCQEATKALQMALNDLYDDVIETAMLSLCRIEGVVSTPED